MKGWWWCRAMGTLMHCFLEGKVAQSQWKSSLAASYKIRHRPTRWPSHSTPGHLHKRNENICPHKSCTQIVIADLLAKARKWKQPSVHQQSKWINKIWCVHTMEYYPAIKSYKTRMGAIRQMNLKINTLNKATQPSSPPPRKGTSCLFPLTQNSRK